MTGDRPQPGYDSHDSDTALVVPKWFELYDDGTPDHYGSTRYLDLYADDADLHEMPTATYPEGRRGDPAKEQAEIDDTNSRMHDRHVTLHELVTEGDVAVARYTWSARVVIDGLPWPTGTRILGECASLFEVRDGQIVHQVDYPTHFRGERTD
jgi:ketosteroid isomerase-like protein